MRLAADGITLRRRTGGDDAGWHLKLPVAAGVRDEIRAPLGEGIPRRLAALVRSRTRDAELAPVVRIRTERDVYQLLDADGEPVAEVSVDRVTAKRPETGATAEWAEVEAELSAGGDPEVLDAVDAVLTGAGLRRSAAASKLARALAETDEKKPKSDKKSDKKSKDGKDGKGGKKKSADKKKAGKKSKGKKGTRRRPLKKKPVEPAARPAA